MDDNDIEWLHRYSQELKLAKDQTLTIKELIESHRRVKEINWDYHQHWLNELKQARERGYIEGIERATEYEYVSREKLKTMTLKEITDLLYED